MDVVQMHRYEGLTITAVEDRVIVHIEVETARRAGARMWQAAKALDLDIDDPMTVLAAALLATDL